MLKKTPCQSSLSWAGCVHFISSHYVPRKTSLILSFHRTLKGKSFPLQTWSGLEGYRKLRFPDYMTTARDGGKVVSLTHRPPLPPGNTPGTHFCWRLSRPQGHSAIGRILYQWKIPVTPAGIEPATLQHSTLTTVLPRSPHRPLDITSKCFIHFIP